MAKTSKPSLAETHPELAAQADGWDPTTATSGSGKKVDWKCSQNHVWQAAIYSRASGIGCPICSGKAVLVGFNDLASDNPELAAQADGWDPTTVTAGSSKNVNWKCELGHKWKAPVSRRSSGTSCPFCSGNAVLAGFNDLATINPELAAQADGWDPTTVLPSTNKKVGWKCKLGHRWRAAIYSRNAGKGCPICAGLSVLIGFNDLATINPELAAQADGWDPTTVTVGQHQKVSWKCKLGHRWSAPVYRRTSGVGCPICSGQAVLIGFNDLATINPALAAEADGWDPTTVTAGSNKNVNWKCELGHKWKATISSRTLGTGCPSCAISGFDPNQSGFLYLIDHFELNMFQIGITNKPEDRLSRHARRGWEVIELRGPMDGHLTQNLETSCLHALEKRGAILGHKAGIHRFDGYSEAWTKASLNVTSIKQILDWVYEDDSIGKHNGQNI